MLLGKKIVFLIIVFRKKYLSYNNKVFTHYNKLYVKVYNIIYCIIRIHLKFVNFCYLTENKLQLKFKLLKFALKVDDDLIV